MNFLLRLLQRLRRTQPVDYSQLESGEEVPWDVPLDTTSAPVDFEGGHHIPEQRGFPPVDGRGR